MKIGVVKAVFCYGISNLCGLSYDKSKRYLRNKEDTYAFEKLLFFH
ncbi:hypothetical protein VSO92_13955 [Myroides pelagicus]|nr:hypothetical protein [Myroides pelagicus]MEC4115204.1 hypothetical protein [Myroides pelagicus]